MYLFLLITLFVTISSTPCEKNNHCHCSEITVDCSRLRLTSIITGLIAPTGHHEVDIIFMSNDIDSIEANDFVSYKRARSIDLRRNRLRRIHPEAFRLQQHVLQLYLADNFLVSLPDTVFDKMTALSFLTISNNHLRTLPAGIFKNMASLTELRLQDNNLFNLSPELFSPMPLLNTLYLEHNSLQTAHYQWFQHFTFKKEGELYLDNNPWVCDCRMKDFYNWQIANKKFSSNPNQAGTSGRITVPRCVFPAAHRGKTLTQLSDTQFNCYAPSIVGNKTNLIRAEAGSNVHLKCDVESNPPAGVVFILPNKTEIRPGYLKKVYQFHKPIEVLEGNFMTQTHIEGELNITDISVAQRGTYKCRASGMNENQQEVSIEIYFNVGVVGDSWSWWTKLLIACLVLIVWFIIFHIAKNRSLIQRNYQHRQKYKIDPPQLNHHQYNFDPLRDDHEQEEETLAGYEEDELQYYPRSTGTQNNSYQPLILGAGNDSLDRPIDDRTALLFDREVLA